MKVTVGGEAAGPWTLDLILRAFFSGSFLLVGAFLGLSGWPLWMALSYFLFVGTHAALWQEVPAEGGAALRKAQVLADAGAIGAVVYLTGSLSTVAVIFYPLIIFGVTVGWGLAEGRLARRACNLSYAALLVATGAGWLTYDPFVRGETSHLEFLLTHNVFWSHLPVWSLFATAGAAVLAVNVGTYYFAAQLVRERRAAERDLVESVSRRTVARVVTGLARFLGAPLEQARVLLENSSRDLARVRSESGAPTENAESDLCLAAHLVGQGQGLVDRLEELAHLPADFREKLDLNELIRRARSDLARRYGGRVFSLLVHTDPELPRVRGDRSLLYLTVRQVLENALLAFPEGTGWVQVTSFERGEQVVIECTDNGEGFERAELDRIFDPFSSAHPEAGHPGLGLALVREVVSQHRGKLEIDSAPGAGTTVRVALPRSA